MSYNNFKSFESIFNLQTLCNQECKDPNYTADCSTCENLNSFIVNAASKSYTCFDRRYDNMQALYRDKFPTYVKNSDINKYNELYSSVYFGLTKLD